MLEHIKFTKEQEELFNQGDKTICHNKCALDVSKCKGCEGGYWKHKDPKYRNLLDNQLIQSSERETIYDKLVSVMNKTEIDSHLSDLYVLKNQFSQRIVENYEFKNSITEFEDFNHIIWYDIPFAYDPYWRTLHHREEQDNVKSHQELLCIAFAVKYMIDSLYKSEKQTYVLKDLLIRYKDYVDKQKGFIRAYLGYDLTDEDIIKMHEYIYKLCK